MPRYQGNPSLLRALDHRADPGARTALNSGNAFRRSASVLVAGRLSTAPRTTQGLWVMNQVGGVSEVLPRAALPYGRASASHTFRTFTNGSTPSWSQIRSKPVGLEYRSVGLTCSSPGRLLGPANQEQRPDGIERCLAVLAGHIGVRRSMPRSPCW